MAMAMRLILLLPVIGCATAAGGGRVDLWPMPASVSSGDKALYVAKDLKMSAVGSKYADGKTILVEAGVNVVVHSPDDEVCLMSCRVASDASSFLVCCVFSSLILLQLKFGVDESYNLSIPATSFRCSARTVTLYRLHQVLLMIYPQNAG